MPSNRERTSVSWLGRLDDTRDTLQTRALTSFVGVTKDGALGFGPLTAPAAAGERRERTLGAQLTLGAFVGPGHRVLTETRIAASGVRTEVAPYRALPSAYVQVRSRGRGRDRGDLESHARRVEQRHDRRPVDDGRLERDRLERERPPAPVQGDGLGARRRIATGRSEQRAGRLHVQLTGRFRGGARVELLAHARPTRAVGRGVERRDGVRAHVRPVALLQHACTERGSRPTASRARPPRTPRSRRRSACARARRRRACT